MPRTELFDCIVDEATHAEEEHLDHDYVRTYDRETGPDPDDQVGLLPDLRMNQSSTLIDLCAGTGSLTMAVPLYCRAWISINVFPAMVYIH